MTAPSWPSPFSGPLAAASVARRASASARSLRLDSSHESRRRFTKARVGHAPAPRHVIVGEAPGRLAHFFRKTLVPIRARVRGGEQFFHDRPALALARPERAPPILARLAECPIERDCIPERHARYRVDPDIDPSP